MNSIWNAIKLDFLSARSSLLIAVAMLVVASVISVFVQQPIVVIVYVMMFSTFMSGMVFSADEKNNLHKLFGTLPMRRTDWVTARYLYAMVMGLCLFVLAAAAYPIISMIAGIKIDYLMLSIFIGAGFLYYCFAVSIIYPVYIRVSFSKAYMFTMIPLALIGVGVMIVARKADLSLSFLSDIMQFFSENQSFILIVCFIAGVILVAISAFIANTFYRHKEL
ncbi:MAG: ABC-2 transporter permease [Coriobacteriia bacterium]|nr:ABC-2 transporter permease [Coriobacteriia bacterium]